VPPDDTRTVGGPDTTRYANRVRPCKPRHRQELSLDEGKGAS